MFSTSRFLTSATEAQGFVPDSGAEVAFVGRSNSGKSSAINKLLQRRNLARTSKTPGRTQLVNFFEVGPDARFVDLPGYGFAQVPERVRKRWRGMMSEYFAARDSLKGVVLLVDSRRGLTPFDRQMLAWIGPEELPCLILMTKVDKLKNQAKALAQRQLKQILATEFKDYDVGVQSFSALSGEGVKEAKDLLSHWLTGEKVDPGV